MEPQTTQDDRLNLPVPPSDAATMPLPAAQAPTEQGVQFAGPNPPVPAQAPPLPAAPIAAAQPTVAPTQTVAQTQVDGAAPRSPSSQAVNAELPEEAADSDVIEKAWVLKAKQVVAETRSDPYKQVRELNKVKADYMKKRYNKDIKLPDA